MSTWMIRAGRDAVFADSWLKAGIVGIGWDLDGEDIAKMSQETISEIYRKRHPSASNQSVATAVGQVCRFAYKIADGDTVVMYDPESRLYHLGKVTGPCTPVAGIEGMTYSRSVDWCLEAPRDLLPKQSKNSLGSVLTLFSINEAAFEDLQEAASGAMGHASDGIDDLSTEARYATYEDGIERIKDRVLELSWEDAERLVAGLLKAMGYHATVTQKGADGGRDVVASPDALGLESPHIIVEVKHRQGTIGAPQVRSFIGGLRAADSGLYVSTGGFTREARYEADRSPVPVRLIDLDRLVRLYVESFDSADADTRALLPLVRIWWPA